jgi:hypothetical protein
VVHTRGSASSQAALRRLSHARTMVRRQQASSDRLIPPSGGSLPRARISRGLGLLAASVALYLAVVYLPAHHGEPPGVASLAAAVATVGLSGVGVGAAWLVHLAVLSAAARGVPLSRSAVGRRALANGAGVASGLLLAVAAARLAGGADATSYVHAVWWLAAAAGLGAAASFLLPLPPLPGWHLLLAAVAARGVVRRRQVPLAARVARWIGTPLGLLAIAAGFALGHPLFGLVALGGIWLLWRRTAAAAAEDALTRFLGARTVGQLASPALRRAAPDAWPAATLGGREGPVILVVDGTTLLGAVGPQQLLAVPGFWRWRCAELMVTVADLTLLRERDPAEAALAALGRHGLVLVVRPGGDIAYVEQRELRDRFLDWAALDAALGEAGVE